MKNLLTTSILILLAFGLISCQQDYNYSQINSTEKRVQTKTKGLSVILKEGVTAEALTLTIDDYKEKEKSSTSRFIGENKASVTLDQLADMTNGIIEKYNYPNINNITEKDISIILSDFPELKTKEDVWENYEEIKTIYSMQGSYQLFNQSTTSAISRGKYPGQPDNVNDEEYWLLLSQFWKIDGTQKAVNLATQYTTEKHGKSGHRDKSDAFRHAIWNVLIAKYTDGNKKDRVEWARKFTNAHESGSPAPTDNSLDNLMDYHNNGVGRSYWNSNVSESGILWWYKINIPSDTTIKNAIYNKSQNATYCDTTAKIKNSSNKLVYIPYTVAYPAP